MMERVGVDVKCGENVRLEEEMMLNVAFDAVSRAVKNFLCQQ